MNEYFPNQRYTSEGEPELGLGFVTEVTKNQVAIHFPVPNENRVYAKDNAPLRRAVFKIGETIVHKNGNPLQVEQVHQLNHLLVYESHGKMISEADLGDTKVEYGLLDKFTFGPIDNPNAFELRRETLEWDYQRRISDVRGFLGGRIDLIPHQLYIAHEVSSRFAPRVLLSDQVGLGKTVEACLILHRLLLRGQVSRVLIVVPESLLHQWFVEIWRRFNTWFHIYDEQRCLSLDESAPDGNPFLDDQLILCSIEFLTASEKRSNQAVEAQWDLLIVDEAHHLEWSTEKVSLQYAVIEQLSRVAKGLLLLTATPEQLGQESHFARLKLLDSSRYENFEAFKKESKLHQKTAKLVEKLLSNATLSKSDEDQIALLIQRNKNDKTLKLDEKSKKDVITDLVDQYGPGRVIFRNTRSAMKGFPKRVVHLHTIPLNDEFTYWQERLATEFNQELDIHYGTNRKQQFWFDEDPRVKWLKRFLQEFASEKIVLICKTKEKVWALEKALTNRSAIKAAVFHEELSLIQRDKNAAWFAEPNGARILLCSEIGSEGRNFQFAHHLILFDLPFHPELLEQRIGRLDRIGQKEAIHIHVPFVEKSPQETWVKWVHEGLNAFEENSEGGDVLFKEFGKRLESIAQNKISDEREKDLAEVLYQTKQFQKKLKKTLSAGRNKLLELNSFHPKTAEKLRSQILHADKDKTLELYLTKVFERFHIEMEDLAHRTYFLYPSQGNALAFPNLPVEGVSITMDRNRALFREDIQFITWDHPMVTGAIDLILSSGTGSVCYGELRGIQSPGLLMELIFVLETAGNASQSVDPFFPAKTFRLVVNHEGENVTEQFPLEKIQKQLISGSFEELIDNELFIETLLPNMMESASEFAEEFKVSEIQNGLKRMNATMNYEITRLKQLQKRNNMIRNDEVEWAEKERLAMTAQINNAQIRLDSILVIKKGRF